MTSELYNVAEEVKSHRQAEHDVQPIFLNRWSPRAFSPEPIAEELLWSVFEAARWAPSSNNEQPWRFLVARSEADRKRFLEFLFPGNQVWAQHAPVLVVVVAKKTFSHNGNPNPVATFDCGCAWGYLALQALHNGLITHGMAGFDRDAARAALNVPQDYDPVAVLAIGRHGDKALLPEAVQQREVPSGRRPAAESVMEGGFQPPAEASAEADTQNTESQQEKQSP
ncbi:MAG: nitroreductase family protein [Abitibacteriaceae bacterium]|nr:nitroreductase family protein [Abditibacteriaceae bacterium]